jgi:hypothetical protein
MANIDSVRLPSSLLASEDYRSLSTNQQANLLARLNHCNEIASAGFDAASDTRGDLLEAIDDLELDALSIMGAGARSGTDEQEVSPYRVHSSWTSECRRSELETYVGKEEAMFLASGCPGIQASVADFRAWLERWAQCLQMVLKRFSSAASFEESIAQLVMIDALVSVMLVSAAVARLNASLT